MSANNRWAGFTDRELRLIENGLLVAVRAGAARDRLLDEIEAERTAVSASPAVMNGIRIQHTAASRSLRALRRHIAEFLERWPPMPYSGRASEPARRADGRWQTILSYDPKGS